MKRNLFFSIILLFYMFCTIPVKGQNSVVLTIEEEFSSNPSQNPAIIGTESKQIHLRSSKAAQINALYDENTMKSFHPLAVQTIKQAIGKWEKKIVIPENIGINVCFNIDNNMSDESAYRVNIPYYAEQNILYPKPLAQVKYGFVSHTDSIIMEDIGWSIISDNSLTIKSNSIDNTTGIGNVNSSYSFYAESSHTVTNYLWTYKIRKNDNSFETVATSSSPAFSINPLTVSDSYYRTEHGDLSGKITLQATVNGTPVFAEFNNL